MTWFNPWGCLFMALLMIPNAIFAVRCKDGFVNLWHNRVVEALEQVGRFGCFGLMLFNLLGTWLGFRFDGALAVYLTVNGALIAAYCAVWAVCFHKSTVHRALALSILPSAMFLFSGVMLGQHRTMSTRADG